MRLINSTIFKRRGMKFFASYSLVGRYLFIIFAVLLLGNCSNYKPATVNNLCSIFRGEIDWYEDATDANKRW